MKIDLPEGVTLKTCPFCGGSAILVHTSRIPQNTGFVVYCEQKGCGSIRAQETEINAIRLWNTRT